MKSTISTIIITLLVFSIVGHSDDTAHEQTGHSSNARLNYIPADGYKPTVGTTYIEASTDNILKPGARVVGLFPAAVNAKTLVQRISANSYWVFFDNYSTIFYVGKSAVLLLDPLAEGASAAVLEGIRSVTDKPVTTVLYSHNHADHIGGISVFVEAAQASGTALNIIASVATVEKQSYLSSALAAATIIVTTAQDTVKFENVTLKLVLFKHTAHTDDSAMWFLQEEGILHIPDLINPDQLPFLGFGGTENYAYYRSNLAALTNYDWKILSGGHGNVGYRSDVDFMLGYLDDLEAATVTAIGQVNWDKLFATEPNNHGTLVHMANEERDRIAMDILRPKYSDYYGFEASVPYQIDMVGEAVESYQ